MAIYHASTKPIARSAGRSAVAAAAYRAGVELVDSRTGLVHDYTRRSGVEHTEILTPDGLGAERQALWDAAELAEKRKDARTAREWIVALPAELSADQRTELARTFAQALVDRYGVAVDFAIHAPDREGDQRNFHAHILTTTRQVSRGPGGLVFGEKAHIELSDKARRERGLGAAADEVKAVRALWERVANAALERAGVEVRIDARSLQAQGVDREATQHLGPVASEMERRGVASDRGDGNRQVQENNRERARLVAEIIDLKAERERRAKAAREREVRDCATERETRAGIRHPDKPRWQVERERILTESYNADVAEKLGRWYRIERQGDALVLKNAQDTITDYGDRVTAAAGNEHEIKAMVELARAKGWEQVHLTGSAEFQERAARAFVEEGFTLDDPVLEQRARQAIEGQRQRTPEKTRQPTTAVSQPNAAPSPPRQPTPEEQVAAFLDEIRKEAERIRAEAIGKLPGVQKRYDELQQAFYATYQWPKTPPRRGFLGLGGPDPNWRDPEKERERLQKEMRALGLGELKRLAEKTHGMYMDEAEKRAHEAVKRRAPARYERLMALHHALQRQKTLQAIERVQKQRREKGKHRGHGYGD